MGLLDHFADSSGLTRPAAKARKQAEARERLL
jgi:hypothetical protein